MKINKKWVHNVFLTIFFLSFLVAMYFDSLKYENYFSVCFIGFLLMFIFALTMITLFKILSYLYLKRSKRPDRGTIRLIFLISFLTCMVIILSAVFFGYMDKFVDKLFKLVDRFLVWI